MNTVTVSIEEEYHKLSLALECNEFMIDKLGVMSSSFQDTQYLRQYSHMGLPLTDISLESFSDIFAGIKKVFTFIWEQIMKMVNKLREWLSKFMKFIKGEKKEVITVPEKVKDNIEVICNEDKVPEDKSQHENSKPRKDPFDIAKDAVKRINEEADKMPDNPKQKEKDSWDQAQEDLTKMHIEQHEKSQKPKKDLTKAEMEDILKKVDKHTLIKADFPYISEIILTNASKLTKDYVVFDKNLYENFKKTNDIAAEILKYVVHEIKYEVSLSIIKEIYGTLGELTDGLNDSESSKLDRLKEDLKVQIDRINGMDKPIISLLEKTKHNNFYKNNCYGILDTVYEVSTDDDEFRVSESGYRRRKELIRPEYANINVIHFNFEIVEIILKDYLDNHPKKNYDPLFSSAMKKFDELEDLVRDVEWKGRVVLEDNKIDAKDEGSDIAKLLSAVNKEVYRLFDTVSICNGIIKTLLEGLHYSYRLVNNFINELKKQNILSEDLSDMLGYIDEHKV